ncbi:MAG: hypothetical protein COB08_009575 [Rhodobacteraceae bacterium]|nr:hypothetical protein [Paracoccaceae bacterium]
MFISPEIQTERVQSKDWNFSRMPDVGGTITWKNSPTGKARIEWIQYSYSWNIEGDDDLKFVDFSWISSKHSD